MKIAVLNTYKYLATDLKWIRKNYQSTCFWYPTLLFSAYLKHPLLLFMLAKTFLLSYCKNCFFGNTEILKCEQSIVIYSKTYTFHWHISFYTSSFWNPTWLSANNSFLAWKHENEKTMIKADDFLFWACSVSQAFTTCQSCATWKTPKVKLK